MAASTALTVSVEEYLRTSYRPDMELIDGELKEKPMPSRLHAYTQMMIGHWFLNHRKGWRVAAESEARTEVRPGNFRLPDISITRLGTLSGQVQKSPFLIAIEVLSKDDRFVDLASRAADLAAMGVEHIWLIDPEKCRAWSWSGLDRWVPTNELHAAGPVYLDLAWLWSEIEKHEQEPS